MRMGLMRMWILPLLTALWTCGADDTVARQQSEMESMEVADAVVTREELVDVFHCGGNEGGVQAPLPVAWSLVPNTNGSLAMIMEHLPDADNQSEVKAYLLRYDTPANIISIAHGVGDDGPWLVRTDKDGRMVSYTSPCSPSADIHEYTITVFALSETPSSLPTGSSLEVDYQTLIEAIETVDILDFETLTFKAINE